MLFKDYFFFNYVYFPVENNDGKYPEDGKICSSIVITRQFFFLRNRSNTETRFAISVIYNTLLY